MKISATVYKDRSYVGTLIAGRLQCALGAESHTGAHAGTPAGVYRLESAIRVPTDSPLRMELGLKVLIFRSIAEPEHLLVLHGGSLDYRESMVSTDGSLRVKNEDATLLAGLFKEKKSVTLTVEEKSLDTRTRLCGDRVSDEYVPQAILRSFAKQSPRFVGDIWGWFAKHHVALGCALCHRW